MTIEGFVGDPLLEAEADDPANYAVRSAADPAYAHGVMPLSVARKSKPDDWQQLKRPNLTVQHLVYLRLPRPLTPGRTYTVAMSNINLQKRVVTLAFDPDRIRSESVHVSQIGFRPDDPLKRAFLSLWMGAGGGYTFPNGLRFRLVDAATARTVYIRQVGTGWPADRAEAMHTTRNFNGTAVV